MNDRTAYANADARLLPLADRSVHMIATSPPYWGLRSYDTGPNKHAELGAEKVHDCLAWAKGEAPCGACYVCNLREWAREMWRVLRDDGVCFLNLGDSYSNGMPTFLETLNNLVKGAHVFFFDTVSIAVTAKSVDVAPDDQRAKHGEFFTLLRPEWVGIEDGNDNFHEVFDFLAPPRDAVHRGAIPFVPGYGSASQVVSKIFDCRSVIVSDLNPNAEPEFGILRATSTGAGKYDDTPLAVEEAGEPRAKGAVRWHTGWDTFAVAAGGKGIPDVDLMNQPISLRNGHLPFAGLLGDFRITKASEQQVTFESVKGGLVFTVTDVRHLRFSYGTGSVVPYTQLYAQANVLANMSRAKQEMGIPDSVKKALQADGWICRSTIIWAKPNPMPESVKDRPTKSHEYIFLLTKRPRYHWDADAVKENFADERMGNPKGGGQYSIGSGRNDNGALKTGVWNENGAATGRNIRTVWSIATQPFSGTRLAADYVGDDGKPYIASKDCPIHSPLYYKRNPRRVRRDEQPDLIQRRNADNDDDRGLVPSSSLPANSRRDSLDSHHASRDSLRLESSHLQSSGSIAGYKTPFQNLNGSAAIGGDEMASRTNRTQGQDEYRDDSPDWRGRRYSVVAILRNSPSNRTGRAPLTNRPDTACAQTIGDTGHTQELREYSGPDGHTQANNTEASSPYGLPVSSPSGQTNGHNAYKQIGLSLNLPDISECTCSIAQVDHYATWPPALVEIMVKAGTSEYGVCPECGKPWQRVVEKGEAVNAPRNPNDALPYTANGATNHGSGATTLHKMRRVETVEWRPTCAHADVAPIPAIVLDPFCGSGTTLQVARQLGRIGLGFDLSETYLRDNAAARLGHDQLRTWGRGIADATDYSDLFRATANGHGATE